LPVGPYLQVTGLGVYLDIFGQRLSGDIVIEKTTTTGGASVLRVGINNGSLSFGDGNTALVSATNVNGTFLITPAGMAGRVAATISTAPSLGATFAGTFTLAINTTNAAVNESIMVGSATLNLTVPAGPYLKVVG
jgi:hypothetical protein